MKTYELRSYDIVGGSVNDVYSQGMVFIPTVETTFNANTEQEFKTREPSDKQIIKALKDFGFLAKTATNEMLDIDGDGENIYINNASNGEPFCELLYNDN